MSASTGARGFGRGKLILLGEHAVVHGQPALAAGLDLGIEAVAEPAERALLRVAAWGVEVRPGEGDDDLARAMEPLFRAASPSARSASVEVIPGVPSRAGMGSSAALSVAVVRALSALSGELLDVVEIERRVALAEAVFHGRPSGIDAAVACRGGVLRFVRGSAPTVAPCAKPLGAVIAQVEPRVPTREMVARVTDALESRPEQVRPIFETIGRLVEAAEVALAEGDLEALGRLLDQNHQALSSLSLSTVALDEACEVAHAAGALGAKLTGAGGGGCMMALAPGREAAVAEALAARSSWVRVVRFGGASEAP